MGDVVCGCCYPSCPVPTFRECDKGYVRPSTSDADGGGTYNLPAEYVGRKYRQLVDSYTATTSHETRRLVSGHNFTDYESAASGTIIRTRRVADRSCEYDEVCSGSMTRTEIYREYYDDGGSGSDFEDLNRTFTFCLKNYNNIQSAKFRPKIPPSGD